MSPPDAPPPPGNDRGRGKKSSGADLSEQDTPYSQGYVSTVGRLEPEPVPVHQVVPNEKADKNYSPPPDWVLDVLRSEQRCEPFPAGGRHHIGVWERLVRRLPVTSQAKGVAAVLLEHWPTITPSLARISALSGMSRSSCDNGVYILRLAGLLQLESRPGQRTRYIPTYPARAVTRDEVVLAKRWRRGRRPQPAQPADTHGDTTCPTGRQVPAQPATPPTQPADTTCPTGRREVINEDHKKAGSEVLARAQLHPDGLMGVMRDDRLAQEAEAV